jgi:DNA helicase-2/ATP-dependent DNA helicase PcrA
MLAVDLFVYAPEEMKQFIARWRYLLVDEYQDTNQAQNRLLRCLTKDHDNICVVGDDDQSIYAWRGADISNILNFEKDFPGTLVIRLEQNYRSTGNILAASNAVIAKNTARKGKRLWTSGESGALVRIIPASDETDEAESIVSEILSLRREERASFSEMAFVFRTNFQTRPFEELFSSQGIPYEVIGGTKFFDRREVKDVVCYLRLMANRYDEMALLRIINRPKRGIGTQTIEKIVRWAEEHRIHLYDVLLIADQVTGIDENIRYRIGLFCELIEEYSKKLLAARSMVPVVREIVHASGYEEELIREAGGDAEKFQKSQRWLQELYTSLHLYESDEDVERHDIFGYLERIALLIDDKSDDKDQRRDAVTHMTMHACKGLEFPYVFISGVEDGNIPHARSIEGETVEEERRLFYVAMTRAMKRLYLTWAGERRRYGESSECEPSRFIDEIDQSCLEWITPGSKTSADSEDLVAAFARMREGR